VNLDSSLAAGADPGNLATGRGSASTPPRLPGRLTATAAVEPMRQLGPAE